MSAQVTTDHWSVLSRKVQEWLEYQRITAILGNPNEFVPPIPWGPLMSSGMSRDQAFTIVRRQVDRLMERIDRRIEDLQGVKAEYQDLKEAFPPD